MKLNVLMTCIVLLVCIVTAGCQNVAEESRIFDHYYLTTLTYSSSADILSVIRLDESDLISQSESVIAAWNEKKKGAMRYFNMVTFDEEELTAIRKYCFVANEKAIGYRISPMQKLRFDAEVVLEADVADEPYDNENVKRIAVLKYIMEKFSEDALEVTEDSQTLKVATMMAKYTLNSIAYRLDRSPALAARLSDYEGLEFDHMNFNKGRVRMVIDSNIAKLKVKIGTVAKDFANQPDVIGM